MKKQTASAAGAISSAFEKVNSVLALVGVGIGLHEIIASFNELIGQADEFNKLAQKTGATTESLSSIAFAAKLSGANVEDLTTGMKHLAVAMTDLQKNGKIFDALGVSVKDAAGNMRGTDDVLRQISDRFAGAADGANKTAYAVALFGRGGDALLPMLNHLKALEEEARQMGLIFGSDFSQKSEEFNDNLRRIGLASQAAKLALLDGIVDALNKVAVAMVEARKQGEGFFASFWEGIKTAMAQAAGFTNENALKNNEERLKTAEANLKGLLEVQEGAQQGIQTQVQKRIDATRIEIAGLQEKKKVLTGIIELEKPGGITGKTPADDKPKGSLPPIPRAPDQAAIAELKLYTSTLQQLENQLGTLNGQTEVEKIRYEELKGSLQGLTAEHKAHLLVVAAEIDARKQLIMVIELQYASLKAGVERQQAADVVVGDFIRAQSQALKDQVFQASLIGKTAAEVDKLTISYNLQKQALLAIKDVEEDDDATRNAIASAQQAFGKQQLEVYDAALAKAREWSTGVKSAIDEYVDHATNGAELAKNALTNAFQSAEDALVNFTKTGKLDFRSLADSIITDLLRIQAKKSIVSAISAATSDSVIGAVFGKIGSIFSGGTQAPAPVEVGIPSFAVGSDFVPRTGLALVHRGERITPAGQNSGAGVSMVYNIDARGADPGVVTRLASQLESMKSSIVPQVVDAIRRGGTAGKIARA